MSKPICNVHVHTFNAQYVPNNFVGQFFNIFPKLLTRILKGKRSGKALVAILNKLPRNAEMRKYVAFLKVGIKESQYKIFNDLRYQEGYPDGTRFAVLPLNFKYMGAGKVSVPYEQQLNELIRVAASSNGSLLPYVYIDPRMGTAEQNRDFVKKYIEEKGFVGIKLYPALGYYPYDERLELVYEYAAANDIPIMTHCSSTGVFYNDRKCIPGDFLDSTSFNPQTHDVIWRGERQYQYPFPPINPKTKKKYKKKLWMSRFADNFLDPVNYTDALEKWPNLKICFAHFGLDNDQYDKKIELKWHEYIVELMRKYDNVYTDISYSLHYETVREKFHDYMTDPVLSKKILYGTDFFMTLQEVPTEQDLFLKTQKTFGSIDFQKIAQINMEGYLGSGFYEY